MSVFFKIRKDGIKTWYFCFMHNGVRYRGTGGITKTQALRAQEKRRSQVISGEYDLEQELENSEIGQFSQTYLERRKYLRSHKRDDLSVRTLLKFFKGKTLNSIRPQDIEDYIGYRIKCNVSNGTINRELACLKRMYSLAIKWGETRKNPVKDVDFLEEPPGRTKFLSEDKCQILINCCAPHLKPIVITALNTGMRLSEILSLKWKQVHIDGVIDPCIELGDKFGETKNNKKRFVPLNNDMVNMLRNIENDSEFVFLGTQGKPLKSVRKPFTKALIKSGINDFRFHDLRHTFSSHFVMNGGDLLSLKEILGHSNMKMVERYAHLASAHKRKQINYISGKFSNYLLFTE